MPQRLQYDRETAHRYHSDPAFRRSVYSMVRSWLLAPERGLIPTLSGGPLYSPRISPVYCGEG